MENHNFYKFFTIFIKIKFAPTFTIIFVISTSKYVSIHSFKKWKYALFGTTPASRTYVSPKKIYCAISEETNHPRPPIANRS